MKKILQDKLSKNSKNHLPPGNRSESPKDYKNPTGKKSKISTPKNSGYDEKQPISDK